MVPMTSPSSLHDQLQAVGFFLSKDPVKGLIVIAITFNIVELHGGRGQKSPPLH